MNIGIVGLGLIGASIAKALKKKGNDNIIGFDSDEKITQLAMSEAAVHKSFNDLKNTVSCDMVIFATPPQITLELINSCEYKDGATVCDVCGVKGFMDCINGDIDFVGMHPMAGKEKSGYTNCDSQLFNGANLLLVKRANTSSRAIANCEKLACDLGFKTVRKTTIKEHDEMIAFTSQMPHLLSAIIVSHPLYQKCFDFEGGSLNDFTRIARLDSIMWSSLFEANCDNLKNQIDYLIESLQDFKNMLHHKDKMQCYLKNANDIRVLHERK